METLTMLFMFWVVPAPDIVVDLKPMIKVCLEMNSEAKLEKLPRLETITWRGKKFDSTAFACTIRARKPLELENHSSPPESDQI